MNFGDLRFAIGDWRLGFGSIRRLKIFILGFSRRFWGPAVPITILLLLGTLANAQQRFPPPDFESGHQLPPTATPAARVLLFQYLDAAVLFGCLGVGSLVGYKKRSRSGLVGVSLFSLGHFCF